MVLSQALIKINYVFYRLFVVIKDFFNFFNVLMSKVIGANIIYPLINYFI